MNKESIGKMFLNNEHIWLNTGRCYMLTATRKQQSNTCDDIFRPIQGDVANYFKMQ